MRTKGKLVGEAGVAYKTGVSEGSVAAAGHEQYVVDEKGKKVGVIIPFEHYQQMVEDLHDLAMAAERRDEAPISLEEMKRRLRDDGLLI
jgi:hypothetical protein